jgi:mRNA-degrading endonuclease toxin of MazEF toxin-antitoxin module
VKSGPLRADSVRLLTWPVVVPLTGNTDRLYPSEAVVIFEGKESKAMADQLATVSKERLFRRAGILSKDDMHKVEQAIKIQLYIPQVQGHRIRCSFRRSSCRHFLSRYPVPFVDSS